MTLSVRPIEAFNDNYIWLITRTGSNQACVVDPGDARPVLQTLRDEGLELTAVLLTHHHPDHTGGVEELCSHYHAEVYGPDSTKIPSVTRALKDGDSFELFSARFKVLTVPGHTLEHIALFARPAEGDPLLFSGDTLFAAGCGRLFEGDAAMMQHSLAKLAALPPSTRIYCGHEYTLANLNFALAAEPDNTDIEKRIVSETQKREQSQPTLPSTMALESRTNPFLRCRETGLKQQLEERNGGPLASEVDVFAALRNWKDNF